MMLLYNGNIWVGVIVLTTLFWITVGLATCALVNF